MAYIYIIENDLNEKKYVGKTTKPNPYQRWKEHKYSYQSPHFNMTIYHAMRLHGIDNFSFYVIEHCDDDKIDEREKFWISEYNTYLDGYNSTYGGEGTIRDVDLLFHPHIRPIDCYTLDGEFIKTYRSRGSACKELDIPNKASITSCINGKTFQAGGYRWAWKDGPLPDVERRVNRRGKIYGIHKNGDIKVWPSQADCAEEVYGNRKCNANISKALNSPDDRKSVCAGWYLFRGELPENFTPCPKGFADPNRTNPNKSSS